MPPRFEFKKGIVIRELQGDPRTLKILLLELKRYSFTGYIATTVELEGRTTFGYIVVRKGVPVVYVHRSKESEAVGKAALSQIWNECNSSDCRIKVHAKVDVEEIMKVFGGQARDEAPGGAPPAETAIPPPPEPQPPPEPPEEAPPLVGFPREDPGLESMRRALEDWKRKGYKVNLLELAMQKNPSTVKPVFDRFEADVKKMEVLKTILLSMRTQGYDDRVEVIEAKLTNPEYLLAVEAEIELLRETIDRRKRLKLERVTPKKKEEAEVALAADEDTHLIPNYSFDSFVVGQSNRFSFGAALSVAKTLMTEGASILYNPLFIWSGPGLGKTHLLNAIGNHITKGKPRARVMYVPIEKFTTELEEADAQGRLNEFRKKYRGLDLLLMDDVQFLSGNARAQEELFHTFNALHGAKKQIALACDRPPRDIPDIEDRLVSRFESGLVTDIQVPELETRFGILLKRCEDNRFVIDRSVLELIANIVPDNVRELEGSLNRVAAYSKLMGRELNVDLAKEVLKDLIKEDVGTEAKKVSKEVAPGRSYIIEEDRPDRCFDILLKAVGAGFEPLLITRVNPNRIRARYRFDKDKTLWLTDRESEAERTVPPALESIFSTVQGFIDGRKGIVLIDGIEYLVSMNSFDAVIRFLRNLVDHVSETQSVLLLSVSPKTMKETEIKTVEKEMEKLEVA